MVRFLVKKETSSRNTRFVSSGYRYSIKSNRMQMYSFSFAASYPFVALITWKSSASSASVTGSVMHSGSSSIAATRFPPGFWKALARSELYRTLLLRFELVPLRSSMSYFNLLTKTVHFASVSIARIRLRMSHAYILLLTMISLSLSGK